VGEVIESGMSEFAQTYGEWAVIAGASEGVGLAFAHGLAEHGINTVLISRRRSVLEEVAHEIRQQWGVQTHVLAVDLAEPGAANRVIEGVGDLQVGLLVYCAGGDPNFVHFLDSPIEDAQALVHRNCVVPVELSHHFAQPMVERRRGGIILVTSGAALVGARRMVAYGASKAFDLVMGEALWAELRDSGVNILSLVLGVTDTPALRRLLAARGNLASPDDGTPIPGAATSEEVVGEALANLSNGPTHFIGETLREGSKVLGAMARNEAARVMLEAGAGVMDQKLS